jgi:hypothetical protein
VLAWAGDHVSDVHEGCKRFFRPGYSAHLIAEWLPALHGVVEKLRGASVADVRVRPRGVDDPDGPGLSEFDARRLSGGGYDLVTMCDCLQDMGDPVGAARHVRVAA